MSQVNAFGVAGANNKKEVSFYIPGGAPGTYVGFMTAQGSFVGVAQSLQVTVNPDGSETAVIAAVGGWKSPLSSDFITPGIVFSKTSAGDIGSIQVYLDGTVPLNEDNSINLTGLVPLLGTSGMSITP